MMRSAVKAAPEGGSDRRDAKRVSVAFDDTPDAAFAYLGDGGSTATSPSPRVLLYDSSRRGEQSPDLAQVLPTGAVAAPERDGVLAGLEFDTETMQDEVKYMKRLETLQILSLTQKELEEELMGQKLSNEELLSFLESGERRIVDLALKVRLQEEQLEAMVKRDAEQTTTLNTLESKLSVAELENKRLEGARATLEERVEALEYAKLEALERMAAAESRWNADMKKMDDDREKREQELEAAHQKAVEDLVEEHAKRTQECDKKMQQERRSSKAYAEKLKEVERELVKKTETATEKERSCTELDKQVKTLKSRVKKLDEECEKRSSMLQRFQNEHNRLRTWENELSERQGRLDKREKEVEEHEKRLKQSIDAAFAEIKARKEAEENGLIRTKNEYQAELFQQFQENQGELNRHWQEKEQYENEQLEVRRVKFEEDITTKMTKVNDSHKRLGVYAQNLERYGETLKTKYERWKQEEEDMKRVLDKAQEERRELEAKHRDDLNEMEESKHEIQRVLDSRDCVIMTLKDQIGNLERCLQESQDANVNVSELSDDLRRGKAVLQAENKRLTEDNAMLEKCFAELKGEHEQSIEEMNHMRNREEEERELRRRTNDMLLASYKVRDREMQGGIAVPRDGTKPEGSGSKPSGGHAAADVVCWDCHENALTNEAAGLVHRAQEARGELMKLKEVKPSGVDGVAGTAGMFIKAHMLDAERLEMNVQAARAQVEVRKDTALLTAERKSLAAEASLAPSQAAQLSVDPDVNPLPLGIGILTPQGEGAVDSSRRRKKDLTFLKSMYSSQKKA